MLIFGSPEAEAILEIDRVHRRIQDMDEDEEDDLQTFRVHGIFTVLNPDGEEWHDAHLDVDEVVCAPDPENALDQALLQSGLRSFDEWNGKITLL